MRSLRLVIFCLIAAGFFMLAETDAQAMPKKDTGASFKAMDKNNDGQISKEEFFEAFPSMKDLAFSSIDTDSTESISPEEWDFFFVSHSMDVAEHDKKASSMEGMANSMEGMEGMEGQAPAPDEPDLKPKAKNEAPELIMPSKKD